MERIKNDKINLKGFISKLLKSKESKKFDIYLFENTSKIIANKVINDLMKEAFYDKDFESLKILVKMKEALKDVEVKDKHFYITKREPK